tara:strand:- start:456 stop:794 length:339 start_codon:yes stop_codon:yes gene_type:complete
MSYRDKLEVKIDNYDYGFYDRIMYGGLGYGTFCLPTNLFRIIFTVIFPPLGVMFDYLIGEFPYVNFKKLIENLNEIIYVFILTAMFYIPGLIYALMTINKDTKFSDELTTVG